MRDVTKFKHAAGTVTRAGYNPDVAPFGAAGIAAQNEFVRKYGRLPDFDVVHFRGATSTTDVVLELWEEP